MLISFIWILLGTALILSLEVFLFKKPYNTSLLIKWFLVSSFCEIVNQLRKNYFVKNNEQ